MANNCSNSALAPACRTSGLKGMAAIVPQESVLRFRFHVLGDNFHAQVLRHIDERIEVVDGEAHPELLERRHADNVVVKIGERVP